MNQYSVDPFFDSMSYSIARNDNRPSKFSIGCQGLWCEVILQQFRDLQRGMSSAANYLNGRSPGFLQVCELAGVDPEMVRNAAKRMERGEIQMPSETRGRKPDWKYKK